MSYPTKSLTEYFKNDVLAAINICQVLNKPEFIEKFGIILVKINYLSYWDLIDEFNELNEFLMKSIRQ